jgi:hypothetical protein
MFAHDPLEIPAGAQDRKAPLFGSARERVLVEEADRLQPQLRRLEQPASREASDVARAHDQRRPETLTAPARLHL